MEKYTVCIAYVKHENVRTRSYVNLNIRQVNRLEKIYQQAQENTLIKFLQFSKIPFLYTALLAYCKHGEIKLKTFHRLTKSKVDKLRAIYQKAEEQQIINTLRLTII